MKLIYILSLVSFCSAANILLMYPLSTKSHVHTFLPLFKKLSERGHNLTIFLSFEPSLKITNYTYTYVKEYAKEYFSTQNATEVLESFKNTSPLNVWLTMWNMTSFVVEDFLKQGLVQELIHGNNSFDLMIAETHYWSEVFASFGYIFDMPIINTEPHTPTAWSSYLTGNANPYSYVPNFVMPLTDHMTFKQRLQNTLLNLLNILGSRYYHLPSQERLMRKYLSFGERYDFPPLIDMLKNTSLTLVDSHFSLGYVRPYLPNIVEVGGLSFHPVGGELDEEYKKFMDESENGVILFTFGSMLDVSYFPQMMEQCLNVFAQLKQRVIMKWIGGDVPNKPENVKLSSWLPQNGILGHPKCRLFITHGGVHGMTEAIYHKVPLVVIPFFGDQHYNALFAEKEGFAYILQYENITAENLLYAINTVLANPEYKRNVERRSRIIQDKPLSALDTAVYWVEYVLRHKGATHLKPGSLDLNIFQYLLIDVILALLVAGLVFCYTMYLISRLIINILRKLTIHGKKKSD